MTDPKDGKIFDFNVKQYEEHRQCLLSAVQEERQMERYALLACAVFYSWLATQNTVGKAFLVVASFVPAVIVFLSTLRMHALANGVRTEAKYLRKLEEQIYTNAPEEYSGPTGWESFLDADGKYGKSYEISQNLFGIPYLFLPYLRQLLSLYLELKPNKAETYQRFPPNDGQ